MTSSLSVPSRECDRCDKRFTPSRSHHALCRHCWALPPLVLRAQRYAGVEERPPEKCTADVIGCALALLDAVEAQGRGGVDA